MQICMHMHNLMMRYSSSPVLNGLILDRDFLSARIGAQSAHARMHPLIGDT
jgi:hypothetical protein